jgi:hypothetical protein
MLPLSIGEVTRIEQRQRYGRAWHAECSSLRDVYALPYASPEVQKPGQMSVMVEGEQIRHKRGEHGHPRCHEECGREFSNTLSE